jgi:endonuclease YncB( thermonuclease family)
MDLGSHFIGRLTTVDGQSAALMLVQAGLAKVYDSPYVALNYEQLIEAQKLSKTQRMGLWIDKEHEEKLSDYTVESIFETIN